MGMKGDPLAVRRPGGREVLVVASDERLHFRLGSSLRIHIDNAGIQVQGPIGQTPRAVGEGYLLSVGTPIRDLRPILDDPSRAAG